MEVYQEVVSSTRTYAIGVLANRIGGFLMLPVYSRYLSPADFGVMAILDVTLYLFDTLLGMRIGEAVLYFHANATGEELKTRTLRTALAGVLAIALVTASAAMAGAEWISQLALGSTRFAVPFRLLFAQFGLSLVAQLMMNGLRAMNRPSTYVRVAVAQLAVSAVVAAFLLVVMGMGVNGVLLGSMAGTATACVVIPIVCPQFRRLAFDRAIFVPMVRYSWPLVFSTLAMMFIHYGDRVFLERYVSLAELGIYSMAYKIGMLVGYAQAPFTSYWESQVFHVVKNAEGRTAYVRLCTYLTLALTAIAVFLGVFSRPILRLIMTSAFVGAARYVPLIAGAYVIKCLGDYFRCAFLLERKSGLQAVVTAGGALSCLLGYVFLIPVMGTWGAVAATVAGFTVTAVLAFWQAQRVSPFQFEYGRLAKVLGSGVVACSLFALLNPQGALLEVGAGIAAFGTFLGLLLLGGVIHDSERVALAVIIRQNWSGLVRPKT